MATQIQKNLNGASYVLTAGNSDIYGLSSITTATIEGEVTLQRLTSGTDQTPAKIVLHVEQMNDLVALWQEHQNADFDPVTISDILDRQCALFTRVLNCGCALPTELRHAIEFVLRDTTSVIDPSPAPALAS